MNAVGVSELTAARVKAARLRSSWLSALGEGLVTADDFVAKAAELDGEPLRRVRLSKLLAEQPGWSTARADKAVARLRMILTAGHKYRQIDEARHLTVGWLLDARGVDRSAIWSLVRVDPPTLWAGFPFAGGNQGTGGR